MYTHACRDLATDLHSACLLVRCSQLKLRLPSKVRGIPALFFSAAQRRVSMRVALLQSLQPGGEATRATVVCGTVPVLVEEFSTSASFGDGLKS